MAAEGPGGNHDHQPAARVAEADQATGRSSAEHFCFSCSRISSESFLCDCQLRWLPPWLLGRTLQASVTATCAHPEALQGRSIFSVPPESFVCGKPVCGRLPCRAWSQELVTGGSCDQSGFHQLLGAACLPRKPHVVFTARPPHAVLGVHALGRREWGGSVTNQSNQLQEDSLLFQEGSGAWCGCGFAQCRSLGFNVFLSNPKNERLNAGRTSPRRTRAVVKIIPSC